MVWTNKIAIQTSKYSNLFKLVSFQRWITSDTFESSFTQRRWNFLGVRAWGLLRGNCVWARSSSSALSWCSTKNNLWMKIQFLEFNWSLNALIIYLLAIIKYWIAKEAAYWVQFASVSMRPLVSARNNSIRDDKKSIINMSKQNIDLQTKAREQSLCSGPRSPISTI